MVALLPAPANNKSQAIGTGHEVGLIFWMSLKQIGIPYVSIFEGPFNILLPKQVEKT
jgi:hypothetical protein